MKPRYEAVVIGSGFGGAVAACRLAQAGFDVAVLERGKRYDGANKFPRDWKSLLGGGWIWPTQQGLVDAKPVNEMQIVQASGWGGGSLVYANVHLRPVPAVFASGWPAGYSRATLDPYYDLVAHMFEIKPITEAAGGLPQKTIRMRDAAKRLERHEQFVYPNLAVRMEAAGQDVVNIHGVMQKGCDHCGECIIGCTKRAKNTLDLNYLAVAEAAGAQAITQCEVFNIETIDNRANGDSRGGYRVHYYDHSAGGLRSFIEARQVFVCAGAVNSTELLLRCRDEHRSLPKLSDALGQRYSGNGDLLAFGFNLGDDWSPSQGPTITTALVWDRGAGDEHVWFSIEEGGFPKELAAVMQLLNPRGGFLAEAALLLKDELVQAFKAAANGRLDAAAHPDHARTALFLAMGRDRANGRIGLQPQSFRLHVQWDVDPNRILYDAEQQLATDLAKAFGGQVAFNPFWRRLSLPISVHNLGGCTMSDARAGGVVDGHGEVHGYPDLFVLDGAILPGATGVNPSHTIAAVAERNIEAIIRRRKPGFTPPERAAAKPLVDPLFQIKIPEGGTMPSPTATIGLSFCETMKGFLDLDHSPPDDFNGGEKAGQKADRYVEFNLKMSAANVDEFLDEKTHAAVASGEIHVDGFTGPGKVPVTNGVFNLFVETDNFYERKMLYALPFYGYDGKPYLLDGFKEIKDHGRFDVWKSTTTLYTVVREGHSRQGKVLATGIMHIHFLDVLKLMSTMAVSGTTSPVEKAHTIERFGRAFVGTLWDLFVKHKLTQAST
jgi:cholesterol oxidase